jgi:hypothetical protein
VVLGIGFVVGLAASFITLLLLDATRDVLITPEAVTRKLRLPVLVAIAHQDPPKPRNWRMVMQDVREFLVHLRGLAGVGAIG